MNGIRLCGFRPARVQPARLKRGKLMRYRQCEVCQRQIIRRRVSDAGIAETFEGAREAAGHKIEILRRTLETPARIAQAISCAKHRLVFSKPGKRPGKTNGRSKIIPVVVVQGCVRMR